MPTIDEIYETKSKEESDIKAHMPTLKKYSGKVNTVVEFGVRTGRSTIALLAGRPKEMVSVDISDFAEQHVYEQACSEEGVNWKFIKADDRTVHITRTDLLFIDTEHFYEQLQCELRLHSKYVKRFIVMHDTHMPPWCPYLDASAGMWRAIGELLATGEWYLHRDDRHCYGLTILGRSGDYIANWNDSEFGFRKPSDETNSFH